MHSLVIGSEGFVGKPLCSFLEASGDEVIRFDIQRGEHEDARHQMLELDRVDRVYFLAWDAGGAKYLYREETQHQQLDWNLKLLLNVMPQLHDRGTPFLFVSSQLAGENDTVYGVVKRLGEVWTQLLHGARVRLWNVYGVLEEPTERSHVISDFVWQALTTGEIRLLTTGQERRQFVHIDDVCAAFREACARQLPDIYDVSSFEWIRVIEIAEMIGALTGARVVPGSVTGSTPLTPMKGKLPGWLPHVSLEAGLARMVVEARRKLTAEAR